METKEDALSPSETNKEYIPEKYHWKKSYTLVLTANAVYIVLFYFLMKIFT